MSRVYRHFAFALRRFAEPGERTFYEHFSWHRDDNKCLLQATKKETFYFYTMRSSREECLMKQTDTVGIVGIVGEV